MLSEKTKILLVAILSYICAGALIWMLDVAFIVSKHPLPSILTRIAFVTTLILPIILKNKRIIIYYLFLSFPFMGIAFSGINLLVFYSFILMIIYRKEIITYIREGKNIYKIPIIVIIFCFFYTSLISKYPYSAFQVGIFFFFPLILIYLTLISFVKSEKELKTILYFLRIIFIFCILVSFWQLLFGINSIKLFFGAYNPNTNIFGFAKRIPSVFSEAQGAGQYFAVMTLISIGLLFTYYKNNFLVKCLVILGVCSLFFTISRMALLSFICGLVFVNIFTLSFKKIIYLLFFICFLSLFGALLYENVIPSQIKERFNSYAQKESFDFRFKMWEKSLVIIRNNPWGVGLGGNNIYAAAIKEGITSYNLKAGESYERSGSIHFENSFLSFMYSLGVLGFFGFIFLLVKYFTLGYSLFKKGNYNQKRLSLYLMASMFVWLSCSYTSPQIKEIQPMFIFTILFVLMSALDSVYIKNA